MTRRLITIALAVVWAGRLDAADQLLVPYVADQWRQVAGDPDLGAYMTKSQEPVDFAVWQAADGTWQLWSCIRNTGCGGKTRLFYRWEGGRLTDADWTPKGVAMEADESLGETAGGLQAPHVIKKDDVYYMFYGDWNNVCLARSDDGKRFERVLGDDGTPALFTGPYENSRDPMTLRIDDLYYCYYMGHKKDADPESAVFYRTSSDLRRWSDSVMVAGGGAARKERNWFGSDAECPHVIRHEGLYYLFRTQRYGKTNISTVYASSDPLDFGVDDDRCRVGTLPIAAPEIVVHDGKHYVAALLPSLKGIRMARLGWKPPSDVGQSPRP
jgi:hypothetical protein